MHVWDTEISDSLGTVQENEHLDLLDYLIAELKQRDIKTLLTPVTYYDNAYPDGATPTEGFANYISKEEAPKKKEYCRAHLFFLNTLSVSASPRFSGGSVFGGMQKGGSRLSNSPLCGPWAFSLKSFSSKDSRGHGRPARVR